MTASAKSNRWLRLQLLLGLAATGLAVLLHWQFLVHAGGLWRDEAGLTGLATLPTWRELWRMLTHDSFPILFPALIRLWCGAGWGQTDWDLRGLGMGCGLLLLASFWMASRWLRQGVPLLPLALVGLNALAVRASDSLRAYGLGCALNVLTLALIWRVLQKPQRANLFLAGVAAVLSVQCLYQNAFFVLAACSGGMVLCARARRWRDGAWILGIGLAAAVSLLPYVGPVLHSQSWWVLQQEGFSLGTGWEMASQILGFPWSGCNWVWAGLCVLAGILAWQRAGSRDGSAEVTIFCGVALGVGIGGFYVFLKLSGMITQHWYYLPLMAFVAACLDGGSGWGHRGTPWLCLLIVLAGLAACWSGFPTVQLRQTNVDLVAKAVASEAGKEDYVVLDPWYYGVSFNRYYHGMALWDTVPPVQDHTFHRYDFVKQRMQEPAPLQPVYDRLRATLQAGHRVWLITGPLGGVNPQSIGPAPGEYGWQEGVYDRVWGKQLAHELSAQAQTTVWTNAGVVRGSRFEDASILVAWATNAASMPSKP